MGDVTKALLRLKREIELENIGTGKNIIKKQSIILITLD
jgi:hypothetical protein